MSSRAGLSEPLLPLLKETPFPHSSFKQEQNHLRPETTPDAQMAPSMSTCRPDLKEPYFFHSFPSSPSSPYLTSTLTNVGHR